VTGIPACPSVLLEQQWKTGAAGRNAPAAKQCQQPTHTHKSLRQQDVATCPLCGSPLCGCRDKYIQILRAASEATSYRRAACFMNGSTCQTISNTTAGKNSSGIGARPLLRKGHILWSVCMRCRTVPTVDRRPVQPCLPPGTDQKGSRHLCNDMNEWIKSQKSNATQSCRYLGSGVGERCYQQSPLPEPRSLLFTTCTECGLP